MNKDSKMRSLYSSVRVGKDLWVVCLFYGGCWIGYDYILPRSHWFDALVNV